MANENSVDVSDLKYSAVDAPAFWFDFVGGRGKTWRQVDFPGLVCSACGFIGVPPATYIDGGNCPHCPMGFRLSTPDLTPAMNYFYPLPYYTDNDERVPEADQMLLYRSMCDVVLVKITEYDKDVYALTLTGGGMDLSWDICLAYVLLGYAPPMRFCDLPSLAGQDNRAEPYWSVLKACLQTAHVMGQRAKARTRSLAHHIETALSCPRCGHYQRHDRSGTCDYVGVDAKNIVVGCLCEHQYVGRPADANTIMERARGRA